MEIDFQLRITAQQRQVRCHGSWEQETMGPDHVALRPSPWQDQVSPFYTSHLRHGSRELWVPGPGVQSVSLSLSVSCCTNRAPCSSLYPFHSSLVCSHSTVSDGRNHPVLIGNVNYHLNPNQAASAKNLPVIESRRGCDYPESSTNNWWKIRAQEVSKQRFKCGMITWVKLPGFSWNVTFQKRRKPDCRVIIISSGIDRRWKSWASLCLIFLLGQQPDESENITSGCRLI